MLKTMMIYLPIIGPKWNPVSDEVVFSPGPTTFLSAQSKLN